MMSLKYLSYIILGNLSVQTKPLSRAHFVTFCEHDKNRFQVVHVFETISLSDIPQRFMNIADNLYLESKL